MPVPLVRGVPRSARVAGSGGRAVVGQPAFEGSMRQARGGVLRELRGRDRAATIGTIAAALGLPVTRVDLAVDALERDGLVERTGSGRVASRRADAPRERPPRRLDRSSSILIPCISIMRAILIPRRATEARGVGARVLAFAIGSSVLVLARGRMFVARRIRTTGRRGGSPSSRPSIPCTRPRRRWAAISSTSPTSPHRASSRTTSSSRPIRSRRSRRPTWSCTSAKGSSPRCRTRSATRKGVTGRPPGGDCRRSNLPAGARRASRSIRTCGSTRSSTRRWSTRCAPRSPRRRPSDASTFRVERRRVHAGDRLGWPTTTRPVSLTANER